MSAPPTSPYKGLNAFEDSELDALLFFGREREREIVVANLIASRLTVLYGPSGVGKSSLLRAAVARSLRSLPEEPLVVVFSRWSEDPASALVEAIGEVAGTGADGAPLDALERAQSDRDVYLVLDQAEEYFLYHADDRGPGSFAEALPAVLATPYRINVLVSLREDSLAKLDRFTGRIPGLFANTLRLDRLDRPAARAAIVRPVARFAELTGESVAVEDELVERVLDEVGAGLIEPALGGLGAVEGGDDATRIEAPYLQLVMQRIWDEERAAGSSMLRGETLDRLGGAQHIVEEHLEGALEELTSAQKDIAARLFNHLVTPSGTKIAHEIADLADFGRVPVEELRPVLDTLAERRILRSLEEGGDVRYEIFHDVLAQPVLAWRTRHRTEREVEAQLAEAHRRRSRLQRLLALALLVLGLIAAATVFAFVQRANAEDKERDARARRLDASAVALLQSDPELGLLLATESARMSPGRAAEDALRQSLLASHARGIVRTRGPVGEIAFSPDGRLLAFASESGWVRVRDLSSGRDVFAKRVGKAGGVSFSEDGSSLVLHGSASPPVEVDAASGKVTCVLEEAGRPVGDAAIVGVNAVVVRNARGYVWDRARCRLLQTVDEVGKTAVRVVPSADGSRAAFVSGSTARVVEVPSGRQLLVLPHPSAITSLAFDGDGETIVTGSRDGVGRVWSGNTGRLRRRATGAPRAGPRCRDRLGGRRCCHGEHGRDGADLGRSGRDGGGRALRAHELRRRSRLRPRRRVGRHGQPGRLGADVGGHRYASRPADRPHGGRPRRSLLAGRDAGGHRRRGRHGADLGRRDTWGPRADGCRPALSCRSEGDQPHGRRDREHRRQGRAARARGRNDERARPTHAPRHQRRVLTGRAAPGDREQGSRRDPLGRRLR